MARIKWLVILLLVVSARVHGQDSEDYQAHGDWMIETKKYYRAVVSYKKAIELDSTNANAYFKCALAYYGLANLSEARNYFNLAITKNSNYTLARYQRSMLLIHMQQFGEAIRDLDFILGKSPNDTNFIFLKCVALYHHGEYEDAINLFSRLSELRQHKNPLEDKLFIGNCHLHLKNNEEAISLYNEVLSKDPDNYEALINRAFALLYAGKKKEACKEFESFVQAGYHSEAVVSSLKDHCK